MSLIICPECGKQISDKAELCVHCGYPLKQLKNKNILICTIDGTDYDFTEALNEINDWYKQYPEPSQDIKRKYILDMKSRIKNLTKMNDYAASVFSSDIIINRHIPRTFSSAEYPEPSLIINTPRCPKCGSTAITTGPRGINFTFGLIGASKTVNRCANCGHTWKPKG